MNRAIRRALGDHLILEPITDEEQRDRRFAKAEGVTFAYHPDGSKSMRKDGASVRIPSRDQVLAAMEGTR